MSDLIDGNIQNPPPSAIYASNTYKALSECSNCKLLSYNRDMYPVTDCCPRCGGEVVESGTGKWIPPVLGGFLWLKVVKPGYWSRAK